MKYEKQWIATWRLAIYIVGWHSKSLQKIPSDPSDKSKSKSVIQQHQRLQIQGEGKAWLLQLGTHRHLHGSVGRSEPWALLRQWSMWPWPQKWMICPNLKDLWPFFYGKMMMNLRFLVHPIFKQRCPHCHIWWDKFWGKTVIESRWGGFQSSKRSKSMLQALKKPQWQATFWTWHCYPFGNLTETCEVSSLRILQVSAFGSASGRVRDR